MRVDEYVVARQTNETYALASEYRRIGDRLRDYKNHRFPSGSMVQVNDPRFKGIGCVTMDDACPPDKLALTLESGNVWWYPIENCTHAITKATQSTTGAHT